MQHMTNWNTGARVLSTIENSLHAVIIWQTAFISMT